MAVVKDYQENGHCRIIVHDDFFRDRPKEEVEAIIGRVSEIVISEELRRSREQREREANVRNNILNIRHHNCIHFICTWLLQQPVQKG